MSVPPAAPATASTSLRFRTGNRRRLTCPVPSGRSRPLSGPASPPRAARSTTSSAWSNSGSEPRWTRSSPPATAARSSGRSSTTPISRPGTVPADALAKLRQRGCLVVRGHFDRGQALAWDSDMVDYVESNAFFENYRGPGDDFFAAVGSRPRSIRSTGPPPRCRPARATGWPGCRLSSTASGSTTPRALRGSTRTATRCTRTASGAGRRAPTPADSGPISTPGPSNCG